MKKDRRVIRTKKAIRDAFVSLLEEHELRDITITEICRVADINRKTFYNYYNDVFELMDEIEYEIVHEFEMIVKQKDENIFFSQPNQFFTTLTKTIADDYEFYEKLINANNGYGLVQKIRKSFINIFKEFIIESKMIPEDDVDFVVTFIVSGMVGVYQDIFRNEISMTQQEITRELERIVTKGTAEFIIKS